jgi:transposase
MTKRRRRSFSLEFKAEVVALCRQPDRTVASVARELDLTETAVRRWVNQADVDNGRRAGTTTEDAVEMARLRRQLREVTEERDILARAVGFFAKGTR